MFGVVEGSGINDCVGSMTAAARVVVIEGVGSTADVWAEQAAMRLNIINGEKIFKAALIFKIVIL
jgi:hypothetical protein